jgi:biopolymer transport protein ExbD
MADTVPEGINDLPDPSTFAAPEGAKKGKKSPRAMEEPGGLSMNSLMDIMTIILVFLLKSYSTDPVQLKAAPDLKPPFSSAELKAEESTVITLTLNNVLVDDKPTVRVAQGKIDDADMGGGFLIQPLFERLNENVEHQKRVYAARKDKTFDGVVTIVSDRHVPFRLLSQVMYTAGQAYFSKFKFMVVKGGNS